MAITCIHTAKEKFTTKRKESELRL